MWKALVTLGVLCCAMFAAGCVYSGADVVADAALANAYEDGGPPAQAMDYRLSGPHRCNNLAVYLVHGIDRTPAPYLPLAEAMRQGLVVVEETGSVGRLVIVNRSERDVFVQSGEIVKGGRQDRTFAEDVILPREVVRSPIDSFCVESGRWSQRGSESSKEFGSSSHLLASKDQRLAARLHGNQGRVWASVSAMQAKLASALSRGVSAGESPSSLQLTLENPYVAAQAKEYVQALGTLPQKGGDALGCVVVINGKVDTAEVYATREAFETAWPRVLYAAAVESMARAPEGVAGEVTEEMVRTELAKADAGRPASRQLNDRTRVAKYEAERWVMFETWDLGQNAWVRRSYVSR